MAKLHVRGATYTAAELVESGLPHGALRFDLVTVDGGEEPSVGTSYSHSPESGNSHSGSNTPDDQPPAPVMENHSPPQDSPPGSDATTAGTRGRKKVQRQSSRRPADVRSLPDVTDDDF